MLSINVNCVAPGIVDGPRSRDKHFAERTRRLGIGIARAAERHTGVTADADVANACLLLVSRQITGVDLPVDGGWAML